MLASAPLSRRSRVRRLSLAILTATTAIPGVQGDIRYADDSVLLGEDSGAHLAALLGAERPSGVIGAVIVGGFYDLAAPEVARDLEGGPGTMPRAQSGWWQPELSVTRGAIGFLLAA
jgi:hypothetical protein